MAREQNGLTCLKFPDPETDTAASIAIAGCRQIARGLSNPAAFRGAYQLRRHGELSIDLAMHLHPLKVRPTGFQARCQVGGDRADILLQVCLVATHAPSQRLQGAAYVQGYSAIVRFTQSRLSTGRHFTQL